MLMGPLTGHGSWPGGAWRGLEGATGSSHMAPMKAVHAQPHVAVISSAAPGWCLWRIHTNRPLQCGEMAAVDTHSRGHTLCPVT